MAEAKRYQVLWTDTAQQDLTEIVEFIAQDSVENALAILHKLEAKAALLVTLPNRGRIVPSCYIPVFPNIGNSSAHLGALFTGSRLGVSW